MKKLTKNIRNTDSDDSYEPCIKCKIEPSQVHPDDPTNTLLSITKPGNIFFTICMICFRSMLEWTVEQMAKENK